MEKEEKNKKNYITILIALLLIALIIFIAITITKKYTSKVTEDNNNQTEFYGDYYGQKIKKIALMYYLENDKMISSNDLENKIKNVEDYKFTGSEISFSDIECKNVKTEENGNLKLIDCNSKIFNNSKDYTYETNILTEINSLTYDKIDKTFTAKSMQGLSKIKNININIKYSVGCDKDELDNSLRQVNYNSIKYVKVKRDGQEVNSEIIKENDDVSIQVCKRINLDNIDKKINISSIDLNNKLPENNYEPIILKELAETVGESIFELEYKYKYENGTFYIKDSNGFKKEYNNVKKVYNHKGSSCGYYVELFIITEDKIYLVILDGSIIENDKSSIIEKEIYKNSSYNSIYAILIRHTTCGSVYKFVAYKSDNTFYNLETSKQLDMAIKYNYYEILTTDRKFNDYDTKLTTKVVIKDSVVNSIKFIIDSNDYLYGYIYNNDITTFKKISDKKIKTIYYNNDNKYAYIEFEDGTFYNDNVINAVNIDY